MEFETEKGDVKEIIWIKNIDNIFINKEKKVLEYGMYLEGKPDNNNIEKPCECVIITLPNHPSAIMEDGTIQGPGILERNISDLWCPSKVYFFTPMSFDESYKYRRNLMLGKKQNLISETEKIESQKRKSKNKTIKSSILNRIQNIMEEMFMIYMLIFKYHMKKEKPNDSNK